MLLLDEELVYCLVLGASILGTGGGGNPHVGLKMLLEDLQQGLRLVVASPDELKPGVLVVCAYFCGPVAKGRGSADFPTDIMREAIETLEKYLGKKVGAIIATELGGRNTAVALHLAATLGLPLVDADQVGRAAPELVQTTYYLKGVPAYPAVLATRYGDVLLVKKCVDMENYERIARSIADRLGVSVFIVDSPIEASRIREVAITGTITECIRLGKLIMDCRRSRKNIPEEVAKFLDGYYVFKGIVKDVKLEVRGGFLVGEYSIEGVNRWYGHTFRIWVKNENLIAWLDDKIVATCPDLICVLDDEGWGVTNDRVEPGLKVHVIVAPAPEIWRTPRGLEVFGPKHFGFNIEYVPVEQLVGNIATW